MSLHPLCQRHLRPRSYNALSLHRVHLSRAELHVLVTHPQRTATVATWLEGGGFVVDRAYLRLGRSYSRFHFFLDFRRDSSFSTW